MNKSIPSPLVIIFLLILISCKSLKSNTDIPIESCKLVTLTDNGIEFNKLTSDNHLVFTFSYNRILSRLDTVVQQKYKLHTEELTKEVIKKVLPNIVILENEKSKTWSYNDVYHNSFVPLWHRYNEDPNSLKKYINYIALDSEYKNQLIIEISSYILPNRNSPNTHIKAFIIDASANTLLYYDAVSSNCDSRNDNAYVKALYFVLERIKNQIKL